LILVLVDTEQIADIVRITETGQIGCLDIDLDLPAVSELKPRTMPLYQSVFTGRLFLNECSTSTRYGSSTAGAANAAVQSSSTGRIRSRLLQARASIVMRIPRRRIPYPLSTMRLVNTRLIIMFENSDSLFEPLHGVLYAPKRACKPVFDGAQSTPCSWIPAYAGMTEYESIRPSLMFHATLATYP
jgi:hypothetical protein